MDTNQKSSMIHKYQCKHTFIHSLHQSIFIYFSWKGNGEILSIESHLSDTRLFQFIKLIKTIPFTQSNQNDKQEKEKLKKDKNERDKSTKETYETIEQMTPVKKILYEDQKLIENHFKEIQFIQLQAKFTINKVFSFLFSFLFFSFLLDRNIISTFIIRSI